MKRPFPPGTTSSTASSPRRGGGVTGSTSRDIEPPAARRKCIGYNVGLGNRWRSVKLMLIFLGILAVLAVGTIVAMHREMARLRAALILRLDTLNELMRAQGDKLALSDKLERTLNQLQGTVEELEGRSLTSKENALRRFWRAQRLTLADVEQWRSGQTFDLISCSYYYPNAEPFIDAFEYRHEHLGGEPEIVATARYLPVVGFNRADTTQEWEPYTFFASAEECATRSHTGTVRRLRATGTPAEDRQAISQSTGSRANLET